MADFTQNLSDSIKLFGIQPSTKWGSPMKWGTDLWGTGSNTNFNMPTISVIPNTDIGPTLFDLTYAFFTASFNNDIVTFQQGAISESLFDGSLKYNLQLPGGVTNDENAVIQSYAKSSNPSGSWTLSTTSSTTWIKS